MSGNTVHINNRVRVDDGMVVESIDGQKFQMPAGTVVVNSGRGLGYSWYLRGDGHVVSGPAKSCPMFVERKRLRWGRFEYLGNMDTSSGSAEERLRVIAHFASKRPDLPELQSAVEVQKAEIENSRIRGINKPEMKRQRKMRDEMSVGAAIAAATLQAQSELAARDKAAELEAAEEKPDAPKRRGRPPNAAAE